MLAYFQLEQVTPEPFELDLIRVWDRVALEFSAKAQAKANKQK